MPLQIHEIGRLEDNSPTIILKGTEDEIKRVAKLLGEPVDVVRDNTDLRQSIFDEIIREMQDAMSCALIQEEWGTTWHSAIIWQSAIMKIWHSAIMTVKDLQDAHKEFDDDDLVTCENCMTKIRADQPYSYDSENSLSFCEDCTASYEDMLKNPTYFYHSHSQDTMTAEQAQEIADQHVANGGKLTDKMGLIHPDLETQS